MKSYTNLEQSKKLAEFLPIESADMYYHYDNDFDELESIPTVTEEDDHFILFPNDVRCWSLAALLNAVDFNTINLHYDNAKIDWVASATIHDSTKHCTKYESTRALNPVDACVEMILDLHELKML